MSIDTRRFTLGAGALAALSLLHYAYAFAVGSASIPHNDDWETLRILFNLVETGDLVLTGWNEMVLLGHLAWAYPVAVVFRENIAVLTFAGALFSGASVFLAALLARRFLSWPFALGAAALVAIFPGHLQTTVTYMTDPVALVAQLGCILVGLAGVGAEGRRRYVLIALAMVLGLFAFSIREFGALAPAAVGMGLVAQSIARKKIDVSAAAILLGFLAAAVALYAYRQGLPEGNVHSYDPPGMQRLIVLSSQALMTIGLALSPVLVFIATTRRAALVHCLNVGVLVALGSGLIALQTSGDIPTCCHALRGSIFTGNALTEVGFLGNQALAGQRPVLFSYAVWASFGALGLAGGSLIAGWIWNAVAHSPPKERETDPAIIVLVAWGAFTAAAVVTRAALGAPIFDRYLTVPLLVAAIFALRSVPAPNNRRDALPAAGLLLLVGIATTLLLADSHSFDAARWRAGQAAVREGTPPSSVDAGFEWVGYHYGGIANPKALPDLGRVGPGYLNVFPEAQNCVIVAASQLSNPELTLITTAPYESRFGLRTHSLWVYRNPPACASAE